MNKNSTEKYFIQNILPKEKEIEIKEINNNDKIKFKKIKSIDTKIGTIIEDKQKNIWVCIAIPIINTQKIEKIFIKIAKSMKDIKINYITGDEKSIKLLIIPKFVISYISSDQGKTWNLLSCVYYTSLFIEKDSILIYNFYINSLLHTYTYITNGKIYGFTTMYKIISYKQIQKSKNKIENIATDKEDIIYNLTKNASYQKYKKSTIKRNIGLIDLTPILEKIWTMVNK